MHDPTITQCPTGHRLSRRSKVLHVGRAPSARARGLTNALIKDGLTVAATTKLLKNAQENAKANPTLRPSIAAPWPISAALGEVITDLKSGQLSGATLSKVNDQLGTLESKAVRAGIPVTEKQVPLGG